LGIAALLWRDVRLTPQMLERWTESHLYPRAALRYLKALDPGPRLLNHYNWGGYLMLHAPEFKVMIDGRANTLYDEKTYLDYVALTSGREGLSARLAQYPFDAALIPSGSSKLAEVLASPRYGWRAVYADPLATILLPPGSPRLSRPLPRAEDVEVDEPDWLIARGVATANSGDRAGGRALIEAAIERDPLLVRAYGELARLDAADKNAAGVAAAIERGIAAEPRATPTLRLLEAVAYDQMGDPARALGALEQAVPRGPFSRPDQVETQIQTLRAQLANR